MMTKKAIQNRVLTTIMIIMMVMIQKVATRKVTKIVRPTKPMTKNLLTKNQTMKKVTMKR